MQILHYLEAFLCPHCFVPLLFVSIAIVALKISTAKQHFAHPYLQRMTLTGHKWSVHSTVFAKEKHLLGNQNQDKDNTILLLLKIFICYMF